MNPNMITLAGNPSRTDGPHNAMAKLTWDEVRAIRAIRADPNNTESYAKIGKQYGISAAAAYNVVKKRSWRKEP